MTKGYCSDTKKSGGREQLYNSFIMMTMMSMMIIIWRFPRHAIGQ